MRLAHTGGTWALVGSGGARLLDIAGRFSAWAPRLANGEGVEALPLTGAFSDPARASNVSLQAALGRSVGGDQDETECLGAVIGNSFVGRSDPFQSLAGYVLMDCKRSVLRAPLLVTRREFGPELTESLALGRGMAAEELRAQDAGRGLQVGDVVSLGPCRLSPALEGLFFWAD